MFKDYMPKKPEKVGSQKPPPLQRKPETPGEASNISGEPSVDQVSQRPLTRQLLVHLNEQQYKVLRPQVRSTLNFPDSSPDDDPTTPPDYSLPSSIDISNLNKTFLNLSLDASNASTQTVIPPQVPAPTLTHPPVTMADITVSEAFQKTRNPAIPKFISPQIFNPSKDNPEIFLKNFERTSIANGWNSDLKITFFGTFLDGAANRWYEYYIDENKDDTWNDIIDAFKKEFKSAFPTRGAEDIFENAKQSNTETINDYFYNLKLLAYDADPKMTDAKFIRRFERGLNPRYENYYRLVKKSNMTTADLREIVDRLGEMKIDDNAKISPVVNNNYYQTNPPRFFSRNGGNITYAAQPRFNSTQPNRFNTPRQNFPPTPRTWTNTNRLPPANSQARNNFPQNNRYTPPRPSQNTAPRRFSQQTPNPLTRRPDGRPQCYRCGKVGHFATTCWQQLPATPNASGRQ